MIAAVATVYLAALIGVALVVVTLSDWLERLVWKRKNPPEKLAADREKTKRRLLSPDWSFYEAHLERPAPHALRELYSDVSLLTSGDVISAGDIYVTSFEPLDADALVDAKKWLGLDVVPIATGDGDLIYLRPGREEGNAVFITYHDGGDTEQLAHDVLSFVAAVRASRGAAI